MPFKSQAQRGLFYAALKDPKLRKERKLNLKGVKAMVSHDEGGKLPQRKK